MVQGLCWGSGKPWPSGESSLSSIHSEEALSTGSLFEAIPEVEPGFATISIECCLLPHGVLGVIPLLLRLCLRLLNPLLLHRPVEPVVRT